MNRVVLTVFVAVLPIAFIAGGDSTLARVDSLRAPSRRPSMILEAERGYGNACMGGGRFWTALHVADGTYGGGPVIGWRTGVLTRGTLNILGRDKDHDLAWGFAEGDFVPKSVPIAKRMPAAGERLWMQALLVGDFQAIRLPQYAFVVRDGLLYTDGLSWPGMSGACLLNESDELVAINLGTTFPYDPPTPMVLPASRWAIVVGR